MTMVRSSALQPKSFIKNKGKSFRHLTDETGHTNWNRGRREVPPAFAQGVSEEQQPRIFRLIDTLAKSMIPLGWSLTDDLQFARDQDMVTLTISEATDQILHTPTREENLKLLEHEKAR